MNIIYKIAVFIIITFVIVATFAFQIPNIPVLGDKARIIFLHVPTAWLSVLAFFISMINSVLYLRKKEHLHDIRAYSAAEIGFMFTILATITGSLWAKFSWGSFWNWDPRETSIFILLLIYGAYFALRSAIDNPDTKARLSSVYSIIAFVTVPFFIFIMPRIVSTFSSLIGFTMLFFWILNLKIKIQQLLINKSTEI